MIALRNVSKRFVRGGNSIRAVDGISLEVPMGEFVVITGPSGSGKSTLLHLIAGVDRPTEGDIVFEGQALSGLNDDQITMLRRRRIGLVFQSAHLLPALNVNENVALPLLLDGVSMREARRRAAEMLDLMHLGSRQAHRPNELSGGEMQRVAIARALIIDPVLVLADEPTGSLDSKASEEVLTWLRSATHGAQRSAIMVTHDRMATSFGDRVVAMRDGRLIGDTRSGNGTVTSHHGHSERIPRRDPGPEAA